MPVKPKHSHSELDASTFSTFLNEDFAGFDCENSDSLELQNISAVEPQNDPTLLRYGFYSDYSASPQASPIPETLEKLRSLYDATESALDGELRRWDSLFREIHHQKAEIGFQGSLLAMQAPKLHQKLRELVEAGGIPAKYRNTLWFELSGARGKIVHGEYRRLLAEAAGSAHRDIELDLRRTLPENKFLQSGQLAQLLGDILRAYVIHKPHAGYTQGMNKILGNILLAVNDSNSTPGLTKLNDEDVFWLFVSVTEDFVPQIDGAGLFERVGHVAIEIGVLKEELPKLSPLLEAHFRSCGTEIEMFVMPWWLGMFSEVFVSLELWFRFLDTLLVSQNSNAVFSSCTLALIRIFENKLLCMDCAETYRMMSHLSDLRVNQRNLKFAELVEAMHTCSSILHLKF